MAPISPDDWQRLEPLFDSLLDLPQNQRHSWLQGHKDLTEADRGHLQDLLQAHDSTDGQLDSPLPPSATQLAAASLDDPLVGEVLGPFEVVEEIGRGGMGVVYLGRRTDGEFQQEVVIKVLRLGIDSDDTRRRFLQERQILADLDHPGIVRLLDGGFTSDGRPYLVMNRVVGQRVDSYCDRKQLDIRARVRLFLGITEAVDYAHRNLVIHRDLKPSNVWVDDEGKVHLLDFGIAKIADEEGGPGMTQTHHRVMTPEYASPEQIRQEAITTASDVYQLGILLYQLLTGQYPHNITGRSAVEMEREICGKDPLPPSRAVTALDATEAVAHAMNQPADFVYTSRSATAAQLKKVLQGDLDVILQKILRKEPSRRYLSAHELREDLIRWLSGDRVLARPDSLTYQARRFVRRHPLVVGLMATFVVCSLGFTLFHVQRITAERDIARLEAERRREVSEFLVSMFKVPDPTTAQGREVTAQELLSESIPRINEDLSDPETKIRLLEVVGEVSKNLGLYDQAGPALNDVVTYTAQLHGERSLETAAAYVNLVELWRWARMYDDAIVAAEKALSIRREILPAGDLEIGKALKMVAMIHRDLRQYDVAEEELREALIIYETLLPPESPARITVLADLAYVLRTVGDVEEAEALYRQVLPAMRQRSDEFREALPGVLNNLAYLLSKKDENAEAELLYKEAIERNENHFGVAHPNTLMFRNNLAKVLRNQDKLVETEQELRTCIELQEHLTGAEHWRTGMAHRSLGVFLYRTENFVRAEPEMRAAYDNFKNGLAPDHLWTLSAGMQVATCLHLLGHEVEAEAMRSQIQPLLANETAHNDPAVQFALKDLVEHLPAGNDNWGKKLAADIAVQQ